MSKFLLIWQFYYEYLILKQYNIKIMPEIIQTNPKILGGQPVIKGTRIPIARIVALHIQGYKIKDFKKDYPYLTLSKNDLRDIYEFYLNKIA